MRNYRTFLGFLTSICMLFGALSVVAQSPEGLEALRQIHPAYVAFIQTELDSGYKAHDSTVDPKFLGRTLEPFKVKYIEMPGDRLNLETAKVGQLQSDLHFFVSSTNRSMVRFYIHPDSEYLYKKLIEEFGVKGYYWALPTASTRTVLAWDPSRPNLDPIFLKLSLARKQLGLGRVIPGWEVRRSVRITETFNEDLNQKRIDDSSVSIINEIAGAYIKKSEGLGFYVDDEQGEVFDHGYIIRDASFITRHSDDLVVPMFWLFAKGKSELPPIGAKWKNLNSAQTAEAFNRFMIDEFFKPFIEMTTSFMVNQGYAPQMHGQNVVLILDRVTLKIKKIYHRDLGSFKVDYRLRWLQGLPTNHLKSELADKDFGLSWAMEKFGGYISFYLYYWNLVYASPDDLKKVIPEYDPSSVQGVLATLFNLSARERMGGKAPDYVVETTTPTSLLKENRSSKEKAASVVALKSYIQNRKNLNQSVRLPSRWSLDLKIDRLGRLASDGYLFTDYGLLYHDRLSDIHDTDEIFIAFYASNQDREALVDQSCNDLLAGHPKPSKQSGLSENRD